MSWEKNKAKGKNKYYSLSNKLRRDGKSNIEFELMINALSLEEVIGLKLELASKHSVDSKLYGIPIWHALPNIVRDAVLKYAVSATRSTTEAAKFLGIQQSYLANITKKFGVNNYFKEEVENPEDI